MLNLFKHPVKLLFVFLGITLFMSCVHAQSQCADLFAQTSFYAQIKAGAKQTGKEFVEGSKQYGRELVDTWGMRVLLKNPPPENIKYAGFVTYEEPNPNPGMISRGLSKFLDYFESKVWGYLKNDPDFRFRPIKNWSQKKFGTPNYRLTPFKGLNRNLYIKSFQWFFLTKRIPTFLTTTLLTVGGFYGAESYIANRNHADAVAHKADYLEIIQDDFRYRNYKLSLQFGFDDENSVLDSASYHLAELDQIINHADSKHSNLVKEESIIKKSSLFSNLWPYFEDGVLPKDGYVLHRAPGPLTETEKRALIASAYALYTQYALVSDYIFKTPELAKDWKDPQLAAMLRDIENSEYRKQLEVFLKNGKLTLGQYNWRLQQDYFNQHSFAVYKILQIEPLDDDGKPFGLNDVRNESLNEIDQVTSTSSSIR